MSSVALALASAAAFATSGVFARGLLESGWSPGAAVLARIGGAAVVLLVPTVVALRSTPRPTARQLRRLVGYGAVAVAGAQACYFGAVAYLTPGVALLLEYVGVVLLVGWMWARHGQQPSLRTTAGVGVCAVGLLLVLDVTGSAQSTLDPRGVGLALAAAVCLAVYFAMSARTEEALPAVVMVGGGLIVATVTLAGLTSLGALPFRVTSGPIRLAGSSVPWWLPALGLVLISTAAAFLTGVLATRRLGATSASFLGLIEVAFTVLWAALLLGELPRPVQLLGGAVLIGGVAVIQATAPMAGRPRTRPGASEATGGRSPRAIARTGAARSR